MMNLRDWWRRGSAFIWGSGALLTLSLVMITGLVGYIAVKGLGYFWPRPLVQVQGPEGPVLGEVTGREPAHGGTPAQIQFRVGNRDLYGQDFRWFKEAEISGWQTPSGAVLVERMEYGAFVGFVQALQRDGQPVAQGPGALVQARKALPDARRLRDRIQAMEKDRIGSVNTEMEALRVELRQAESARDAETRARLEQRQAQLQASYDRLQAELDHLRAESGRTTVLLSSVDGQTQELPLAGVVRLVPSNDLGVLGKTGVYLSRLWEFVWGDPRESNTEGGIFPAIFGTVMMVLIMSAMAVPLGVLAALFLREYAKQGWVVRAVRIAVNNLAGVPSIVFGIFGLGFFVYTVGGSIDRLFYPERLPTPTYGTGGILWASLTLALLTVPVVIVATEEALATVPRSQREASLALGATKWQTMRQVVLPGAMPGILTGLILAMARGAGEVAPLMLTGVVKLAPSMPLDGTFPFLHMDRKFMHLGFHIYDVGFQSPNSEAAKPMVFMTALLLLLVVLVLNLAALNLRRKLRARLGGSTF